MTLEKENDKIKKALDYTMIEYGKTFRMLAAGDVEVEPVELDAQDIEDIHRTVIRECGGIEGVRDENLLDSVIKAPYQSVFGEDLYPTAVDKAAKYAFDFSSYQIYLDGNKRTGMATATVFLQKNGLKFDYTPEEAYDVVMNIANGAYKDASDLSKEFAEHVLISIEYAETKIRNDNEKNIENDDLEP